jgi:hypothetical protein
MMFTVSMPGGPADFELEGYVRCLEKVGVNIANTPRVVDPVTGKWWLATWSREVDARQFAADVRQETENDNWKVYAVPDGKPSTGPLGPIEILVSCRSDGCGYGLSPLSQNLILKRFPQAILAPTVFIATWIPSEMEKTQRPIWEQVARILTGLSEDQLNQLGGYRVIDYRSKRVLQEAPPLVA